MAIPEVTQTVRDFALGVVGADPSRLHVKIGVASAGTVNSPVTVSDSQTAQATWGTGPLVEAIAYALNQPGAGAVMGIRVNGSVAGVASAVTAVKTGTGSVTVSGTPLDDYDAKVQVTANGVNIAAGTGAFKYSLDGGRTYSAELAIPTGGVYAIPNTGLSIAFVNGGSGTSFIAGDVHSFTGTAPNFTVSDLNAAIDAALGVQDAYAFIHVVGAAANATDSATLIGAVESKLSTAFTGHRYIRAMVELPDVADNLLSAALNPLTATRTLAAGGYAALTSAIAGTVAKRSSAWVAAGRAAAVDASVDLAKVKDGPVGGVQALYRDERKTQAFDAARITSLRTFVGKSGFYITNGRLLAPAGSDFEFWQYGRVMDIACAAVYDAMLLYLNDEVEVDRKTGLILEEVARMIEGNVESKLRTVLQDGKKKVSAIQALLDRTVNILSLKKLVLRVRITPLAYPKQIETELAFYNPALNVVALAA